MHIGNQGLPHVQSPWENIDPLYLEFAHTKQNVFQAERLEAVRF